MVQRALPKSLQALRVTYPNRFSNGWMEDDNFDGVHLWSCWITLRPGWCNWETGGGEGLHIIHEASAREALRLFKAARPCFCPDCTRKEEAARRVPRPSR